MSLINQIHTACKNCVFSLYSDLTQTGCSLNYIDKYRQKKEEILEVYDEEKEFYVINNKKCLGYRENKWFEQYGLEHASLSDKIKKFNELNHIQYLLLVDLKEFSAEDLDTLKNAIINCNIKPDKVIFIRYQSSTLFHYNKIKQFFESTSLNCKWRLQTMLDDSLANKDILHNVVNINKGYRFIVSINKPIKDINSIVKKANSVVYEDLDNFVAVANQDRSIILFSAPSYRWSIVVEQKNILEDEENYIIV